jgi:hypothetical protein
VFIFTEYLNFPFEVVLNKIGSYTYFLKLKWITTSAEYSFTSMENLTHADA